MEVYKQSLIVLCKLHMNRIIFNHQENSAVHDSLGHSCQLGGSLLYSWSSVALNLGTFVHYNVKNIGIFTLVGYFYHAPHSLSSLLFVIVDFGNLLQRFCEFLFLPVMPLIKPAPLTLVETSLGVKLEEVPLLVPQNFLSVCFPHVYTQQKIISLLMWLSLYCSSRAPAADHVMHLVVNVSSGCVQYVQSSYT